MNTSSLPPMRRDHQQLLAQLPDEMGACLTAIARAARATEHMAARTCFMVTDDFLQQLDGTRSAARDLVTMMTLWAATVQHEVDEKGDSWDFYPYPLDADELLEAYRALYRAATQFDLHSADYAASSDAADRALAPLLWDCGTACDQIRDVLDRLRTGGPDNPSLRQRPDLTPATRVTVVLNQFEGATAVLNASGSRGIQVAGDFHLHGNYYDYSDTQ